MLLHGLHRKSLAFYNLMFEEKFKGKNNQAKDEHENADTVDAMHVFHEVRFRTIRIGLFNVEIFCYLPEYTHKKNCIVKIQF